MPNLKTCFCHGCGKFMQYPYQSTIDDELYHKICLPENSEYPLGQLVETIKELVDE